MKTIKKYIFLLALALATLPIMAQHYGRPTRHDTYTDYFISLGYQHLNLPTGPYNAGSLQIEALYSFAGGKAGVTYGPNYISFSPFGLLWFVPGLLLDRINNLSPQEGALFLIPAMGTMQIHIPLSKHLEITGGWDAFKITKLKNFRDSYYVHGSLNAGLNFFLGDMLFINAYYEFNHTHNPIIKVMGLSAQPMELKGHSFGFRFGCMLSKDAP